MVAPVIAIPAAASMAGRAAVIAGRAAVAMVGRTSRAAAQRMTGAAARAMADRGRQAIRGAIQRLGETVGRRSGRVHANGPLRGPSPAEQAMAGFVASNSGRTFGQGIGKAVRDLPQDQVQRLATIMKRVENRTGSALPQQLNQGLRQRADTVINGDVHINHHHESSKEAEKDEPSFATKMRKRIMDLGSR